MYVTKSFLRFSSYADMFSLEFTLHSGNKLPLHLILRRIHFLPRIEYCVVIHNIHSKLLHLNQLETGLSITTKLEDFVVSPIVMSVTIGISI